MAETARLTAPGLFLELRAIFGVTTEAEVLKEVRALAGIPTERVGKRKQNKEGE